MVAATKKKWSHHTQASTLTDTGEFLGRQKKYTFCPEPVSEKFNVESLRQFAIFRMTNRIMTAFSVAKHNSAG
jgi:hypothetical protein